MFIEFKKIIAKFKRWQESNPDSLFLQEHEVTDTIYVTETTRQGEMVVDVAPRKMLRKAQTPQAFRLLLIADAYEELQDEQKAKLTDDASVVLAAYDENIFIVPGEESNKKITYKEDI